MTGGLRQRGKDASLYTKTHLHNGKKRRNTSALYLMSYKRWSVGSGYEPQYPDAKLRLFLTVYHRGVGGLSHTIILAAHNQQRSVGGSPAHKKSLQSKKLGIGG